MNIWFDVTEIQNWSGHFTGIQRVIFNIGQQLSDDKNFAVRYCYYDSKLSIFTETDYIFTEHRYDSASTSVEDVKSQEIIDVLKRLVPVPAKKIVRKAISMSPKQQNDLNIRTTSIFSNNDIILSPGAFWTGFMDTLYEVKKDTGVKVVGLIYDLVPLVVPQFTAEVTTGQYKRELPKAIKTFDHWISISQNTKKDLITYARENELSVFDENVSVVRLGAEINKDAISRKPSKSLSKDFILFVSTIEARKNQFLLYQTVKLACENKIDLPLIVLVGKHGWLSDDLIYILTNDQELTDKILWLDKIDDEGLRWLYSNCMLSVYPPYYEGWGLPVAEALAYGRPCIASRSSSIPEIAGDLVDYFSPYNPMELLHLLDTITNNPNELESRVKRALKYQIDSWTDTGDEVKAILSKYK